MHDPNAFAGLIILLMIFGFYLFPTIIAAMRRHHNTGAIAVLNLFLGWTLLGWVGALVWAATAVRYDPYNLR